MQFSSNIFLLAFLPVVVILHFILPAKFRNYLLLVASLFFYAWGEPIYILLMLFSIVINWSFGMLLEKANRGRRILLGVCIAVNLLLLGYYKYFDFFASSINRLLGTQLIAPQNIPLPIGISFFTFQALSYVVDLYRGNCKVQRNVLNLALYISFFPQLIAGPIVRYADIDEQIRHRTVSAENFALGFRRFIYGLAKKVIIANTMAQLTDSVFAISLSNMTTVTAWMGAVTYTMQIYYDFSGYSDMAIGLGKMFGFDFLENFRYPYLSRSIHEFWQRWHISLGTWFREYVYIPLGGNRKGTLRTYCNLITVFFLTGMWHGASWNFIVWGLFHGFFQILERVKLKKFLSKHPLISWIYCLLVVVFGWVLFRSESLTNGIKYLLYMVAPWNFGFRDMMIFRIGLTLKEATILFCALFGCGIVQLLAQRLPKLEAKWKYSSLEFVFLAAALVYCVILLAAGTYNPFIYFRF